ncbi:MAG: rhomboid family intramembrane serine protease [Candidatus Riflebacteria bacterium]|nr:rhomboid family intramembrane serine protease [Candidatus Riflebacteria bacterium]
MDLSYRLVLYLFIANIGYMILTLAKRDFRTYRGYLLQLFTLLSYMILMVGWGENGVLVITVSILFMFIIIIVPVILQKHIESLLAEQRFDELEKPSWWKATLAWSEINLHMLYLARASGNVTENPAAAEQALRELFGKGEPFDSMTRLFLAMIHFHQRRFEALLSDLLVSDKPIDAYSFEELLYIVRGLLETGRFEEAVPYQLELEEKALSESNEAMLANLQIARLLFFAFMGWYTEYKELVESKKIIIDQLPEALREFWGGVAAFNAGDFIAGRARMEKALADRSIELPQHWTDWMHRRLTSLTADQDEFARTTLPRLTALRNSFLADYQKHVTQTVAKSEPPPLSKTGTEFLLGFLFVTFVVSLAYANPNDLIDLLSIGANSGFLVQQGQWFRVITAMCIHLGWLHLILNLIALRFFGPPIETVVGLPMFFAIYVFSGLCGGIATVWCQPGPSVGASGAVLGLLSAAIILELLERNPDGPLARSGQFSTLVFILVINLVIGSVEKGIDNSAHIGGLAGGAIAGFIAWFFLRRPFLRALGNTLSLIFVGTVLAGATYGFMQPRTPLPYPLEPKAFVRIKAGPLPLNLEIPRGWRIATSTEDAHSAEIEGPLGENLVLTMGICADDPATFVKAHADKCTKSIMENKDHVFNALSDPASSTVGSFTCWRMQWRLEVADQPVVERDSFYFYDSDNSQDETSTPESPPTPPGYYKYILIQTLLRTNRDNVYDPLLARIFSSISFKGDFDHGPN